MKGMGPSGVALIVEALTDNRNRTASDMRHIFDQGRRKPWRYRGCVSWMFDRKGLLVLEKNQEHRRR
jgi:transcriptional/translational regulatory protein YebC/TACO1